MRYAIISDIHANLEALTAVLTDINCDKIDKTICVGDIIGYGADPNDCVKKVKECNMQCVLGNHEAGCLGTFGLDRFTPLAREAVIWTKRNLSAESTAYIKTLEIVLYESDFAIAHGTLDNPRQFDYMAGVEEARSSFVMMDSRILFVGHSHVPGIFEYAKDNIEYFYKEEMRLSDSVKYIVNAGSVGQPRDGDNRASYAVYDDEKNRLWIKRVKYDIKKAADKILKAELPPFLASRLEKGL
jgi:predicted phosphodiesterase